MALRTRPSAVRARRQPASQTEQISAASPAGQLPDRVRRPAEQGDRRRQRLRPRVGHPPGRHAQEPADLRDHDPAVGGAGRLTGCRSASSPAAAASRASSRSSATTLEGEALDARLPRRPSRWPMPRRKSPTPTSSRSSSSRQPERRTPRYSRSRREARGLERHLQPRRPLPGQRLARRSTASRAPADGTGNGPVDALFGAVDAAVEPLLGWQPVARPTTRSAP